MCAKVILLSYKDNEINTFLNKFYSKNIETENSSNWQKEFSNPVEISEIVAAFADNISSFDITMWVSLDEDVFVKISASNANSFIKYLFERYPY